MSDSGDRQTEEGDTEEPSGADGGGDDATGEDVDGLSGEDTTAAAETSGDEGAPEPLDAVADEGALAEALENGLLERAAVEPDDQLRQSVEAASSGHIAHALAVLGDALARIDTDRAEQRERADDLESRLRRKQAEFQNYKKRQQEQMEKERERATEDLVERLLDVRDNLARALDTDEGADIRSGVESTLAQFDRELDRENVDRIEPEPGDAVDPICHEVLATVPSDERADAIAEIHRPGYEMAGRVLRPAQVTVSDGPDSEESGERAGDGTDDREQKNARSANGTSSGAGEE